MATVQKKATPRKSKMDFNSFVSQLENIILIGTFKPRERLTEASLSEKFGVSRYLVRNAFKVLETKGLVKVTHFKGVIVSELSEQDVEEIYVIRKALEQLSLRLAMQNVTNGDIMALRRLAKTLEDAHRKSDFAAMVTADNNFHDYVFHLSQNDSLYRMINDLQRRCHIIRYSAWTSPEALQKSMKEHNLIVDAIEARDLEALNTVAEKHLYYAKDSYLILLRAQEVLMT
jgi:DNA-binding GntR family transcriptional regulator